jgi:hypothetical protein
MWFHESTQLELVTTYGTEGGSLLITDATSVVHWRGTEPDGSGVIVEFKGAGAEKLAGSRKAGAQQKKFATIEEARAFEKVVSALAKAKRPRPAKASFV